MMGKTHMIAGAATVAGFYYLTTGHVDVPLVIIGATSALLPDIDHPKSTINQKSVLLGIIGLFYRLILNIFAFIYSIPVYILRKMGIKIPDLSSGHRGPLTHGFVGLLIFGIMFSFIIPYGMDFYVSILLGIASHIFVDMLNPEGVPLAWPFYGKYIRLLPKFLTIKTNSILEKTFSFSTMIVLTFIFYDLFYIESINFINNFQF